MTDVKKWLREQIKIALNNNQYDVANAYEQTLIKMEESEQKRKSIYTMSTPSWLNNNIQG